jgi:hypothetical protein
MPKDLFVQVPEFLAAFDNIRTNGFFEDIQYAVHGMMMEGRIQICSITAMGCIPNDPRYMAVGASAVIDPHQLVDSCRTLAHDRQIRDVTTKIETNPWPLYDRKGEEVIGSKGSRTKLFLHITFKT